MAAEVVSDVSIPNVQTVAEYRRLISLLTNPLLRLFGSALTTEAIVVAAQKGAITLKVGTLDLTQAWTNVGTSFFLGFAIGLFGTDAAKIIIGRLRAEPSEVMSHHLHENDSIVDSSIEADINNRLINDRRRGLSSNGTETPIQPS